MILSVLAPSIGIVVFIALLFINLSPEFGAKSKGKFKDSIERSSNYENGNFNNIEKTTVMKETDWVRMFGFFKDGNKVPDWSIPVEKVPGNYFAAIGFFGSALLGSDILPFCWKWKGKSYF